MSLLQKRPKSKMKKISEIVKKKCSLLWPLTPAVDAAADIARKPLKKLSTVGLSKSEAPMRQTFVGGAVEPTGSSCCISFLMFVN